MIRLAAICFLALGFLVAAPTLSAQNTAGASEEVAEKTETEIQREAFYRKYAYSKSSRFSPRARAVVNPHPTPRPAFSKAYPDFPDTSEKTFQRWELSYFNWTRVSNAYDLDRPLKNCGYCSYY